MSDEDLEKVYVDLPGHWHFEGESLWAKPVGDDLYEIRNVPFGAYGLNYGDVVRAVSRGPDLKPEVREVVKSSGRRTLRAFFPDLVQEDQTTYLKELQGLGVEVERDDEKFVAIDIPPEVDYDSIFDYLEDLEGRDVLEFETCEMRVEGSFTSAPESPSS